MHIHRSKACGFTLPELSISMAVFTLFTLGLGVTSIFITKTFNACVQTMEYSNQQMRITDYISRDLTSATSVQLASNGDITMTLPGYYASNGRPHDPGITNNAVSYGSPDVIVRYYRQNNNLYRSCSSPPSGKNIAQDISDMSMSVSGLGHSIDTRVSFTPRFQWNNKANTNRLNTITSTTLMRNQRVYITP